MARYKMFGRILMVAGFLVVVGTHIPIVIADAPTQVHTYHAAFNLGAAAIMAIGAYLAR